MSSAQTRSKEDNDLIKNLVKTNHRLESKIREQSRHLVEARRSLRSLYDFWMETDKVFKSEWDFRKQQNKFLKILTTLSKYKFPKHG